MVLASKFGEIHETRLFGGFKENDTLCCLSDQATIQQFEYSATMRCERTQNRSQFGIPEVLLMLRIN